MRLVHVKFPEELHARLSAEAQRSGDTGSAIIRRLVLEGLDRAEQVRQSVEFLERCGCRPKGDR